MKNKTELNRRDFVKQGLCGATGLFLLPTLLQSAAAQAILRSDLKSLRKSPLDDDPHFFLMITLPNASGVDASYLWDARPLSMTASNLIQNYRNVDPETWTGTNGVSTLSTDIVRPLRTYQSDFTVLNGVMMDVGFDGHEQNINYLFTGDPFGGECFLPHLNMAANRKPLDALEWGRYGVTQTNGSQIVPLNPSSARSLVVSLSKVSAVDPSTKLMQYLSNRFTSLGQAPGGFSASSATMAKAFQQMPGLSQMLSQIQTDGSDTIPGFIGLLGQVFSLGAAKGAILVLDPADNIYDSHDPVSASKQPKSSADLVRQLSTVISSLKSTAYDSSRSLMDVTTFMFSSEFGRTMRQLNNPIDKTGTDHNPLSNTVIVGGKGIKNGQVLGSSDFNSADEVLSQAHLSLDPTRVKCVSRPYDFANGISRTDLPAAFQASDYLSISSVMNTIYNMFNVPQNKWRLIERNGAVAPVLKHLVS